MEYNFIDNGSDKTLVLFHGTGGDETVLVPVARMVAPNMNYLALRGDVVMDGKRRFCKVTEDSPVMDEEDMLSRIDTIMETINEATQRYDLKELWALGFSNGANTISAIILEKETPFKKAILLRGMNIKTPTKNPDLNKMEILIHSGRLDDIIPYTSGVDLENRLRSNNADVEHKIYELDHRMRQYELDDIKQWFEGRLAL